MARWTGRTAVFGLLLLLTIAAFFATAGGKRVLASFVEKYGGRLTRGEIRIGEIRGNLLSRVTFHAVTLRDARGRRMAHAENVVSEHEIESLIPLRLRITTLSVEQPEVAMVIDASGNNWSPVLALVRSSAERTTPEPALPAVRVERTRVSEGTFKLYRAGARSPEAKAHFHADLRLPRSTGALPSGNAWLAGRWKDSSMHLRAWSAPLPRRPREAQLLSAVEKRPERIHVALSARRRSGLDLRLQASALASAPRQVRLRGLRLSTRDCPLFELEARTVLSFDEGDPLPRGRFTVRGCAGSVTYARAHPERVNVSATGVDVDLIRRALELTTGEASGLKLDARARVDWLPPSERLRGRLELRAAATDSPILVTAELRGSRVNSRVQAKDVPLNRYLPMLLPEARAEQAKLQMDLLMDGDLSRLSELRYAGHATIEAKALSIPSLGLRFGALAASLEGTSDRLLLRRLTLRSASGEGELRASGPLAPATDLSITLADFLILHGPDIAIRAGGRGRAQIRPGARIFAGKLTIDEGSLTLPEAARSTVEPLGELEDVVVGEKRGHRPGKRPFHGSLTVEAPGRLWLRGENMELELQGSAELGLRPEGDLFLTGPVRLRRGHVEFFGRRFEVRQATARFQGNPENPLIDAEATYDASPRDIIVRVDGPLEALNPRFSSDPPGYSEEECLGVLLTGSPDYERRGRGGNVGGLATGLLVPELEKKLGSELPFDTFTVGEKVEVGKYVSDRLFLKLGRDFGSYENEPVNRLTLDFQLSEKWSLVTAQTDRGRTEFDALWTLSY